MITRAQTTDNDSEEAAADATCVTLLARYGNVPVVARFDAGDLPLCRGQRIVVETDRGQELADVLEVLPPHLRKDDQSAGKVVRLASDDDRALKGRLGHKADEQFAAWQQRCTDWKLQLELIDMEWTLDERLILYVLNDRGPETTRLALLAAAGGLGVVHVQPVGPDGAMVENSGGGGCGTGGCGCSH